MTQALRPSSLFIVNCLVSCLAISILLVSTSLAQVNGAGPSDPDDFDTVVNLPMDQDNIIDEDFIVIGGTPGQTIQVNIDEDGFIGDDSEARSGGEVNVSGGSLGSRFMAGSGSEINISSGTVGISFQALDGSLVDISGGTLSDSFEINAGSEVTVSGGNFGDIVTRGSMNISGGTVSSLLQANSGSEVTISGGSLNTLAASGGSQVNLIGREFFVDGQELDTLVPGEAFTVTDRNVTLTGLLADGQPFSFALNTSFSASGFASSSATLTVTLDTTGILLGDVDRDGVVDFLDIPPFIDLITEGELQAEGDIDQSGAVDFLDIFPFVMILTNS